MLDFMSAGKEIATIFGKVLEVLTEIRDSNERMEKLLGGAPTKDCVDCPEVVTDPDKYSDLPPVNG